MSITGQGQTQDKTGQKTGRTNVRWWMVFLAFLAISINYIDRTNLSVAAPAIQEDLGINPGVMGIILGAFFWTYAAFQLPFGWAVDRFGTRLVYTIAVVWWSLFTVLTAAARGVVSLFAFRLLLGAGEAGAYPASSKLASEWFPDRERGLASGIYDSGQRFGTALALPIVTAIVATLGWRASFIITGLIGFVWVVFWLIYYRSPRQHPKVSQEELDYIESGGARTVEPRGSRSQQTNSIRWRDLFRYRTVWGMMLGFFCLNFVIYFFITWFPSYLQNARGFDLLELGIFGALPAIVAIPGSIIGGMVSDRLIRNGRSLTFARKLPLVAGMLFSSVIALAVVVPSAALALALLCVCYFSLTFAAANVWALPTDIAPTSGHVASIGGIQNCASNIAGILTAGFTGLMVGITGAYVTPLIASGVIAIIGAASYLFIVGRVEPLPPLSSRTVN